jgi:16S rRNA (uracil1498-N3)-methyltransferase
MPRKMRTFFDPNLQDSDELIFLDEIESHHLRTVLRLRPGDRIEALDGRGYKYLSEIKTIDSKQIELGVLEKGFTHEPVPKFRMVIAMPKGNRWENMIRPLTELGMARMTPLLSDHSECKNFKNKQDLKMQKWQKIAIDACKQSGNPWLPFFDSPLAFSYFIESISENEKVFIGSLSESASPFKSQEMGNAEVASLLIGPEGGWSQKEEKLADEAGLISFTLGHNTLRLENAAVCGLAVARESFIL